MILRDAARDPSARQAAHRPSTNPSLLGGEETDTCSGICKQSARRTGQQPTSWRVTLSGGARTRPPGTWFDPSASLSERDPRGRFLDDDRSPEYLNIEVPWLEGCHPPPRRAPRGRDLGNAVDRPPCPTGSCGRGRGAGDREELGRAPSGPVDRAGLLGWRRRRGGPPSPRDLDCAGYRPEDLAVLTPARNGIGGSPAASGVDAVRIFLPRTLPRRGALADRSGPGARVGAASKTAANPGPVRTA